MGYLNKQTITVDAILTNRGRQILAESGKAGLEITKFAVADDEIDYTLYNNTHPNGSEYYGSIIENLPLLEATPDEQQIMRYKLVTLDPAFVQDDGVINIPVLSDVPDAVSLSKTGATTTRVITPSTTARATGGSGTTTIPEGYVMLIANANLLNVYRGSGTTGQLLTTSTGNTPTINANGSITINMPANSKTVTLAWKSGQVVGTKTTVTIFGLDTGATKSFEVTVASNS
jgi:hypothetical protein